MSANPYWTDARLATQRPAERVLSIPSPAAEIEVGAFGVSTTVRRRDLTLPSWVVFCMIMLATFAVCVTVTMRANAAMTGAEMKYQQMSTEVQTIRDANAALRQRVEQLRKDPRTVEAAARERLNMVRPNEVVVPLK